MAFLSFIITLLFQAIFASPVAEPKDKLIGSKEKLLVAENPDESFDSRIAYGRPATNEEFPYFASLDGCGAAILSDRWAVTAAHCIKSSFIMLEVGGYSTINSKFVKVDKIFIHRGYKIVDRPYHDIALLKLKRPLTFNNKIQPINLPKLHLRRRKLNGLICRIKNNKCVTSEGYIDDFVENNGEDYFNYNIYVFKFEYNDDNWAEYGIEHSAEYSADHSAEYSSDHSNEYSAEPSAEYSADHSVEYSADHSAEYSADHSVEYSADHSVEYSADHSAEYSADHSAEYSADHSAEYSADYSAEYSANNFAQYSFDHFAEYIDKYSDEYSMKNKYTLPVVVGKGLDETGEPSRKIKSMNVVQLPMSVCSKSNNDLYEKTYICGVPDNSILAGIDSGDSGSPLVVNNTLIGIVSHKMDYIASFGKLGFGFYVNVEYYVPWINFIMETH